MQHRTPQEQIEILDRVDELGLRGRAVDEYLESIGVKRGTFQTWKRKHGRTRFCPQHQTKIVERPRIEVHIPDDMRSELESIRNQIESVEEKVDRILSLSQVSFALKPRKG